MTRGRKRVATEASDTPLGSDNPFAGLDAGALGAVGTPDPGRKAPSGPAASPATDPTPSGRKRPGPPPRLEVRREVRGRGGKTVTALRAENFRREDFARELLRELKQALGCGGSADAAQGALFLQGDRVETITTLLEAKGFRVVRTGG